MGKAGNIQTPGSRINAKSQKFDGHIFLDDDFDNPSGMVRINDKRCGLVEFKKAYWAAVVEGCKLI